MEVRRNLLELLLLFLQHAGLLLDSLVLQVNSEGLAEPVALLYNGLDVRLPGGVIVVVPAGVKAPEGPLENHGMVVEDSKVLPPGLSCAGLVGKVAGDGPPEHPLDVRCSVPLDCEQSPNHSAPPNLLDLCGGWLGGVGRGRGEKRHSPAPQNLNQRLHPQPNSDPKALWCHPEAPHGIEGRLLLPRRSIILLHARNAHY